MAEEIRQLAENSKNTANDIQSISVEVISAVNQLMENAQNLMYFVQNRIMSDYVGFEGATDTYYEKAEHMDSVMAVFNDNISALHKVMAEMNNGITNISTVVEENAQELAVQQKMCLILQILSRTFDNKQRKTLTLQNILWKK